MKQDAFLEVLLTRQRNLITTVCKTLTYTSVFRKMCAARSLDSSKIAEDTAKMVVEYDHPTNIRMGYNLIQNEAFSMKANNPLDFLKNIY